MSPPVSTQSLSDESRKTILDSKLREPLVLSGIEAWPKPRKKTVTAFFGHSAKRAVEIVRSSNHHGDQLNAQRSGGSFSLFHKKVIYCTGGHRDSHTRESRHDLLEQLQQFSTQLCAETCQACDVSPRVGEASDEPNSNRIATACHHNGDRTGGFLCVLTRSGTVCDNDVHFETN